MTPLESRYEMIVVGATAGGIVAAVRAARLGLKTLVVEQGNNLGGVFPSLGAVETHYGGNRSPLLEEIKARILDYYRHRYGEESSQYGACIGRAPLLSFEPHVAEQIFEELVAAEPNLTVIRNQTLRSAVVRDRLVEAVLLGSADEQQTITVSASVFVDATYTGDLAALVGVPYRIGRESRQEYGEPHAGRLFTRWVQGQFPRDAVEGRLNLTAKATTLGIYSGSSGEGDDEVMAYSYRLCLTDDPGNRITPPPPDWYDRTAYLGIIESPEAAEKKRYALHHRFLTQSLQTMIEGDHLFHGHPLPNRKRSWNATNFPGHGKGYAEADTGQRKTIARAHLDHALGLLYFLQHDADVPEEVREQALKWGLAADEFTSTMNLPPYLYVREGRRIRGRRTFTEHDAIAFRDYARARINPDSIAVTEFPLDSLACTTERMPGCVADGQFFLKELSRPGQIPYGVLLPETIDNLLVPGAASVTHVAWGTIRQSPTFIHLCESGSYAAAESIATGAVPGTLAVEALQRRLVESGVMITFFNDIDMGSPEPWVAAVQYLGTKGFFDTYDALPNEPVDRRVAEVWLAAAAAMRAGDSIPGLVAAKLSAVTSLDGAAGVGYEQFRQMAATFGLVDQGVTAEAELDEPATGGGPITRGEACGWIYRWIGAFSSQIRSEA